MNLGAEPKKVAILGALIVAGLAILYFNSAGDSSPSAPAPRVNIPAATSATFPAAAASRPRTAVQTSNGEFRPRVIGTRPEDRPDPASIDPELRLDLLAKVQAVPPIEAGRNLFQFGTVPAPKPIPAVPTNVPPIQITRQTPVVAPVKPVGPPQPPPPPPINLKYYGYVISKLTGRKQACLLDGDEILLAGENDTLKQRYKIVRIALNSIVIEDTQAKSTQTLQFQDTPS